MMMLNDGIKFNILTLGHKHINKYNDEIRVYVEC